MAEKQPPSPSRTTLDELARLYFQEPVLYTMPWGRYLALVLLPFLMPLLAWPLQATPGVRLFLWLAAGVFALQSGLTRWPPRLTLWIGRGGLIVRGQRVVWGQLRHIIRAPLRRGRTEPAWLRLQFTDRPAFLLTRDLAMRSPVRSLNNLAQMLETLMEAARVADT